MCVATSVLAQDTVYHAKQWTTVFFTGHVTQDKKIIYYIDPQLRLIDDKYKFNQSRLDGGLGYVFKERLVGWLGGARIYTIQTTGQVQQEYRLWEQVSWNADFFHYGLGNRTRLEERKSFSQSVIAWRLREKGRVAFSLPKFENRRLIVEEEMFFNLNRPQWVTDRFFSENWLSIGLQFKVKPGTHLEVGYLNQYQFTTPNQMSNVIYTTMIFQS